MIKFVACLLIRHPPAQCSNPTALLAVARPIADHGELAELGDERDENKPVSASIVVGAVSSKRCRAPTRSVSIRLLLRGIWDRTGEGIHNCSKQ